MKKRIALLILAALLLMGSALPAVTCAASACEDTGYNYKMYVTQEAKSEMKKYKLLKKGNSGASVLKMKRRLIELGYLTGQKTLTNKFDQDTEDALLFFQLNNNLTGSDGVAYAYSQYKLYDEFAIPAWGRTYYTLVSGDSGWDVINLQKRLTDTGFLADGQVDGVFGNRTRAAVTRFQLANGLQPDGIAYDWLQEILFSPYMNAAAKQAG